MTKTLKYDPANYKVLSRSAAIAFGAIGLALGALAIWASLAWLDSLAGSLGALQQASPTAAAAALEQILQRLAFVAAGAIWALAAYLFWYARRCLRSRSVPPRGAWIIAGQSVRLGADAVRGGRILTVFAGLLFVLGIGCGAAFWRLAAIVQGVS